MTNIYYFFVKPFTAKGLVWGCVDLCIKIITLVVWVYLVGILISLIGQTIKFDYNRLTQLWWCAYCFLIFFGASFLAYILLFVRDYNTEE